MRTAKEIVEAGWYRPCVGTTTERLGFVEHEVATEIERLTAEVERLIERNAEHEKRFEEESARSAFYKKENESMRAALLKVGLTAQERVYDAAIILAGAVQQLALEK